MTPPRFTVLDVATATLTAVLLALCVWTATQAPDVRYPMQFGLDGGVNRWGSRYDLSVLFGFMGAMTAITAGMMGWYARKDDDPARRRSLKAGQLVSLLAIGGVSFMIGSASLGGAAGSQPPSPGWIMALSGLLFVLVGAGLGRVGPNPIMGVRTPWSYKSRLAWDRSNRLAGRLFFWGGLLLILVAPVAPQPGGFVAVPALAIGAGLWSVFESWRVWRADPDRQPF